MVNLTDHVYGSIVKLENTQEVNTGEVFAVYLKMQYGRHHNWHRVLKGITGPKPRKRGKVKAPMPRPKIHIGRRDFYEKPDTVGSFPDDETVGPV